MNTDIEQLVLNATVIDIPIALHSMRPGAQWVLRGHEYGGLEWHDEEQGQPAIREVEAEIERLKGVKARLEYQIGRKSEYLTIEEQLDLQYWDSVNGTTNWVDHIAEVKSNNPKPAPTPPPIPTPTPPPIPEPTPEPQPE